MTDNYPQTNKRPPSIGVPIQMSAASVPAHSEEVTSEKREPRWRPSLGMLSFRTRRCFLNFLRWFGILLAALLVVDGIFWLWVWHLSPEEFQRFTACLDAGVVPSFWERFVYHIACFGGSL